MRIKATSSLLRGSSELQKRCKRAAEQLKRGSSSPSLSDTPKRSLSLGTSRWWDIIIKAESFYPNTFWGQHGNLKHARGFTTCNFLLLFPLSLGTRTKFASAAAWNTPSWSSKRSVVRAALPRVGSAPELGEAARPRRSPWPMDVPRDRAVLGTAGGECGHRLKRKSTSESGPLWAQKSPGALGRSSWGSGRWAERVVHPGHLRSMSPNDTGAGKGCKLINVFAFVSCRLATPCSNIPPQKELHLNIS